MHLDLNLLTALDALLEENSVAGAAERLNLSAPAMSRTLGRIRRLTGDQILVRTGRTMIPTPHALAIRGEVHDLVQRARDVLEREHELDLANLNRVFSVRAHDAVTAAIGPRLLATVREQAPGVAIRLLAEATTDTNELRHGRVDLEIGSTEPDLPEITHITVAHDRLVAAVAPGHPCATGDLTATRFASADHVIVSRRGRLRDPLDDILDDLGLRRRVVASAPSSTAALYMAARTELLVVVPEHMCAPTLRALDLRTRPLPFALSAMPIILAWHQRYDNDRAHTWLRTLIHQALAQ
ncbi:LysR family transcriptional regulator [Spongiactinospora sp. TRM90649]|uniref:LysR family transcriptional regulator n=1 Tax=Spongiactinospora sp. TRM90649 TaxID=3031114 RepID=UPI0023F6814F|nr:LysR family transcriptional regulator [Spongiactinospora sp. TRM90649]MDF5753572.1 LysR family transcriptional regulator [Spongiactinospora sp. TRM90649]